MKKEERHRLERARRHDRLLLLATLAVSAVLVALALTSAGSAAFVFKVAAALASRSACAGLARRIAALDRVPVALAAYDGADADSSRGSGR